MIISHNKLLKVSDISARDAITLKKPGMRVLVTNAAADPNAEGEAIYFWDAVSQGWAIESSELEDLEKNALKTADIGITVQGYDANIVSDASYVHTDENFTGALKTKLDNVYTNTEVDNKFNQYDFTNTQITATQGQTVYNVTYAVDGYIDVFANGIRLLKTVDYTATNGTSVTLTSGLNAGDVVDILVMNEFEVSGHYTKTEIDTNIGSVSDFEAA